MKNIEQIKQCLDNLLLNRDTRVDRFDGDYIDDFHFILKENYDITSFEDNTNNDFNTLKQNYPETKTIKNLQSAIKNTEGLNISKYGPKISPSSTKQSYGYTRVPIWGEVDSVKKTDDNVDVLNKLQAEYSIQSGGNATGVKPEGFWVREGLTEKKEEIFNNICLNGEQKSVLCIGPRWVEEITFISDKFKCNAVGLDLFSKDKDLITVGDMHDMPFEDNMFDVVYQKNTFNKSYDIRTCLDECIRVLKPGGVIISDECLGYTIGVNELARTSINRNSWYSAYLKNHISEVLVDAEVNPGYNWIELGGLFAARIKK